MSPEQDVFLENLFREFVDDLTLYATSALGNVPKAKELVQDTFLEAILHMEDKNLMTHEDPGGWLMQTLKRKIQEDGRAQRRYLQRVITMAPEDLPGSASSDEPFDKLECKFILDEIRKILTPEEMHLLERLTLDKASHLEVSKELGITIWGSQKRLQRIREKLRKTFPEWKERK